MAGVRTALPVCGSPGVWLFLKMQISKDWSGEDRQARQGKGAGFFLLCAFTVEVERAQ